MAAWMVPGAGTVPRRGRRLLPAGLPRRQELLAAGGCAIVLAHLLLAQLTLGLAVVFVLVGRTSRWRLWWLLAPALAGAAWILAAGPGSAFAGFTAGPAAVLRYLGGGHPAGRLWHPLAAFAGAGDWLPGQFPVALVAGAAEAALTGWLDWLRTDEWAVPAARPGVVATLRTARTARVIRSGGVVTRDGAALGVTLATGAPLSLSWPEMAGGVLVTGASTRETAVTGLQLVHAALRRRKPLLVLDGGDAAVTAAVAAACAATGMPLRTAGANGASSRQAPGTPYPPSGTDTASALWSRGTARGRIAPAPAPAGPGRPADIDLRRVISERAAAILPADSPERAAQACGEIAALADYLRRLGVDGDGLVWVPRGDQLTAAALAGLVRAGAAAGLPVVVGASSPPAAAGLAATVGALVSHRIADPVLADKIAASTGTWLLPAAAAAALGAGQPAAAAAGPRPPLLPPAPYGQPPGADLVAYPVVPPRTLLSLRPGEFVLAVRTPRRRLVPLARLVPARLPAARGHPKTADTRRQR